MNGRPPDAPPQRIRWWIPVVTLILALPACVAIWWTSPGGKQWRNMREAERWLEWATPTLLEDQRFAKLEFLVSTSEQIWVRGEVENSDDVAVLGRLIEQLEPPCPVAVLEIRDSAGDAVTSGYLYKPGAGR